MTIETKTNRVQYVGNGLTTEFPVPFPVLRPDHLRLFLWQSGRQTEMTGGFAVVGAGTGSVSVRTESPVAAGVKLTILREVPLKQEMDLQNGGDFNAETLEGGADILEMQIQQLDEKAGRAIVAPESMGANEVTYETLADLKEEAENAAGQAQAAATAVAQDAVRAEEAANFADTVVGEIKKLSASATSLAPEAAATAGYNAATGVLSLGIPTGRKGDSGAPGKDGSGVNILDAFDDVSKLPAGGNPGDGYLVGEDLYIWSAADNGWKNAGPIRGPVGGKGDKGDKGNKGDQGEPGKDGGLYAGDIRLMPFVAIELPSGWYFANGDRYALTSPQGAALNSLSINYKARWNIAASGGTINLPSLFYSDGRGLFLRAVNGTARLVGSIQDDIGRNATGAFSAIWGGLGDGPWAGVMGRTVTQVGAITQGGARSEVTYTLNLSRQWGTHAGDEFAPINVGMTPAIYLGV